METFGRRLGRPEHLPREARLDPSEISEAWEAFETKGDQDFLEEIADTAIRILDLIGVFEGLDRFATFLDMPCRVPINKDCRKSGINYRLTLYRALLALHVETSEALESFRRGSFANFEIRLAGALIIAGRISEVFAGPGAFEVAIRKKLEVNRTRGFRHGGSGSKARLPFPSHSLKGKGDPR